MIYILALVVLFLILMEFNYTKMNIIYMYFVYKPSIYLFPILMKMGCHRIKDFYVKYDRFWKLVAYHMFISDEKKKEKGFKGFEDFVNKYNKQ